MDVESLICWALTDLDACIRSSYHYHQMRIAGIARLLLFDEHPLAHQVNRTHRLGITFAHGPGVTLKSPDPVLDLDHEGVRFATAEVEPARVEATQITSSALEPWLALKVLRIDGTLLSVREFVQQMAYVEGVVHAGVPKTPLETSVSKARNAEHRLVLNFSEPNLDLLKQIGRVTYTGLRPIYDRAKHEREAKGWPYPTFNYE